MTVKDFIYRFNLAATKTVKDRYEWANILNNSIDKAIDYNDSVSLEHLVDSFNQLYLRFKKEQAGLPNLGIVGDVRIDRYDYYYFDEWNNYRRLVMLVNNYDDKRFIDGEGILYLCQDDGIYKSYLTNGFSEEDFCRKDLSLSGKDIKKYLDLGSKYDVLIDGYNYFKNKQIFGNGTSMIFTKINGDLLNGIDTFEISFGNVYFNYEDYVNVVFRLGDKLEIDYDRSVLKLGNVSYEDKSMVIDEFVKNIYVNKDGICTTSKSGEKKVNENIKKMLLSS